MSGRPIEDDSAREALPTRRWLAAAALLVVEYLLAIFVFDSERLPVNADTEVFGYLGESMPVIIVVMTATFLIGAGTTAAERARITAALGRRRVVWPYVVAHLLTYAAALAITELVFNRGGGTGSPWLWILTWAAAGLLSLVCLVVAVLSPEALRSLARPFGRALASGLFIGAIALLAGYATAFLWEPMSRGTLEIVAFLLRAFGEDIVSDPGELTVGTEAYLVFVDRPCSGYEGIGLITVLLGFYLVYFRRSLRFPNALVLLPMGIALVWLSNALRIAALISVGTHLSADIADGGFHSAAGWLLFCLITLALVSVSRRWSWLSVEQAPARGRPGRSAEGAYLLPLLVLIAASLVTRLFTADFDYLYPLRVAAPLVPLWLHRRDYDVSWVDGFWGAALIGAVTFVFWIALAPGSDPELAEVIPYTLSEMHWSVAGLWLIFRTVGSVLIIPVVEELAFRGYLLRRLIAPDFTAVSGRDVTLGPVLLSSLVFGLLHQDWLAGTLAGLLFAFAYSRRGRLSDAIVAHAVSNGLLALHVIGGGHWELW